MWVCEEREVLKETNWGQRKRRGFRDCTLFGGSVGDRESEFVGVWVCEGKRKAENGAGWGQGKNSSIILSIYTLHYKRPLVLQEALGTGKEKGSGRKVEMGEWGQRPGSRCQVPDKIVQTWAAFPLALRTGAAIF
jgi:hypothetical protein